jgi:hypothetical protein
MGHSKMEKPLVNKKFLLKKMPGKGGWTYADLPQVAQNKHAPFGWVKVKGTIDGIEIRKYHLMPFGDGKLFLPVKAEIRKKIKKEQGDYVHIRLYLDEEPIQVPEEMLLCLKDEPQAETFFNALTDGEKQNYIKWIYSAKQEETRLKRLAETIEKLLRKEKFYSKT